MKISLLGFRDFKGVFFSPYLLSSANVNSSKMYNNSVTFKFKSVSSEFWKLHSRTQSNSFNKWIGI